MEKYTFQQGGEADVSGADFFNQYIDQIISSQHSDDYVEPQYSSDEPEQESEFISGLREYDEEQVKLDEKKHFNSKLDQLQQVLDQRLDHIDQKQDTFDWFATEEGEESFTNLYDTRTVSMPTSPSDPPTANPFAGIFQVESAKTGQPTNLKSSAIGRGQMIRGTRLLMYKKLGITDIAQAEATFRTNPEFEMKVLNAYREDLNAAIPDNIQGKQREYMVAKGWYTGNVNYPDNEVPGKKAGNTLTAGQYARKAIGIK